MPRRVALAFGAALCALAAILALTFVSGASHDAAARSVTDALDRVHHLFAVAAHLEQTSALELEQRAVGTDVTLALGTAAANARRELDSLEPLYEEPAERAQLHHLRQRIELELDSVLAIGQVADPVAASMMAEHLQGMKEIRAEIAAVLEEARTRLELRQAEATRAGHTAEGVVILGAGLLLGSLLFVAKVARDEFRRLTRVERIEERLVGMVTHDLRSPLSAILAEARFLERQPPPVGPVAARVAGSALRIHRLTSVIAAFVGSHLEGGLLLEQGPADLSEILSATVGELCASGGKAAAIELSSSGDCRGEWDRTLLAHLATNLIDNALRHGAEGHPIRVRAIAEERTVRLEVQSQGEISPERRAALFQMLSQREDEPTVRFSGGLGLFVVQAIARAHGGSVSASSSPERGTLFTVILPRRREGGARKGSRTLRPRWIDRTSPNLPAPGRVMVW